ncbi:four helix bundle protein [Microcoleus sp. FACHB-68]|uniref:four helix bundle protein n=1 Tax=Microcoleus sp. FACHB-68 TaxID=2692826 RepID=UPI001682932F|nr:four helix bundle protein [Microcoleus sp. FACHB-68]MBD1936380.1 four helix bundle protein [Microcoleus sp. FACHB-68]
MSKIERFEDLIAWQKARVLTRMIYQITQQGAFAKDFGLSGQIQRAAVSIMSNIAEGFERSSLGEFHQFLSIAKASCAELRSQLYVAFDAGYLTQDEFDQFFTLAREVSLIVGGLRASVEKQRKQSQIKNSSERQTPNSKFQTRS